MSIKNFLLFSLLILASISTIAQEYYRWVDADGVAHYSQQPPAENPEAEQQSLEQTPLTQAIANSETSSETPETVNTDADYSGTSAYGKDPELCAQVLQSLQTMNEFENIVMTDPETGDGIYLSESERAAETIRLEGMRGYYC
jgi:hypothetical protein